MKRALVGILGTAALLAGCHTTVGSPAAVDSASHPASASLSRDLNVVVNAPSALAQGGKIVSADLSGIIAAGSGNIIAAGSGNVIAAGSGNIIAAGSHNYQVASASVDHFTLVSKAFVQLMTLDGHRFGNIITSGDDGKVHLVGVPDGKPLIACAFFEVNGKVYRQAVTLPTGTASTALYADPINTMVEARVRTLVANSTKPLTPLTLDHLRHVWDICNQAGVEVAPASLEMDAKSQDGNLDGLDKIWQGAIDHQVADFDKANHTTGAADIAAFMTELKNLVAGS